MRTHKAKEIGKMDVGRVGPAKAVTSQPTSQHLSLVAVGTTETTMLWDVNTSQKTA
jgi:hypothetical protein